MSPRNFCFVFFAFFFLAAHPAFANGLDTPSGVDNLPFNIEGSPVMNMTAVGLGIGIGTTAPSWQLQVNGAAMMGSVNLGPAGVNGLTSLKSTGAGSVLIGWNVTNGQGETDFIQNGGAGGGGFGFYNYSNGGVLTNWMTILSNGDVGIGLTGPVNKLTVPGDGTGIAQLGTAGCGGDYVGLTLGQTAVASGCVNYNILSSSADQNLYINRPTGYDIHFREANGPSQMFIQHVTGFVGVGNTSPAAAVDVSGAIRATGSTTVSGTAYATTIGQPCTPQGAIAFDTTNHQPVYCNSADTWESFTGLPPNSTAGWSEPTIGTPCSFTTNAAGIPTATIYENTNKGWQSVGTIAGMPMTQSSYVGGQNGSGGLANVWLYQTVCLATQWGLAVSTYYNSVLYGTGCAPWNAGLCSGSTQVQGQPDYSTVVPWSPI